VGPSLALRANAVCAIPGGETTPRFAWQLSRQSRGAIACSSSKRCLRDSWRGDRAERRRIFRFRVRRHLALREG
jgi:hypothetical protein